MQAWYLRGLHKTLNPTIVSCAITHSNTPYSVLVHVTIKDQDYAYPRV